MATNTIPSGLATGEIAELIVAAIAAAFPTNTVRRSAQDEIAIEDDDGRDWVLVIQRSEAATAACRSEGCDGDPANGEGWNGFCGTCADQLDD